MKLPLPQGVDKKWNNAEEYRTIFEGKTSERTLRDQSGLSAVRFGHVRSEPGQAVADAYQAQIAAAENPSNWRSRRRTGASPTPSPSAGGTPRPTATR